MSAHQHEAFTPLNREKIARIEKGAANWGRPLGLHRNFRDFDLADLAELAVWAGEQERALSRPPDWHKPKLAPLTLEEARRAEEEARAERNQNYARYLAEQKAKSQPRTVEEAAAALAKIREKQHQEYLRYKASHPERVKAHRKACRDWHSKNREYANAKSRAYYEAHKEKWKEYQRAKRARAKARAAEGTQGKEKPE